MAARISIPRRSKYNVDHSESGALARTYNGRKYHSAAEAKQAAELDILKRCGRINWHAQHPLPINFNGKYICTAIVDFWVFDHNTGEEYFIEVKGHETAEFKLKRKMLLVCYPGIDYRVVKA